MKMSQDNNGFEFYTIDCTNDFILTLKDTNKEVNVNGNQPLASLGRWVWDSGNSLRIQTQKTSQQVADVFTAETGFGKKDYSIMNAAGITFPLE